MDIMVKISFSAVSHIGSAVTVNDDRVYANGKFTREYNSDCVQISLEDSGRQFLFALSDGMDTEESGISTIKELGKFQQKVKDSIKDIHVKMDELAGCIEQSSNLLHSMSLGENGLRGRKTAFAGLFIDNGSIAAVNMGVSKIYRLDGDNLKLMVDDYKRAERLLKMGIINDEQAEMLTGQRKSYESDGRPPVKRSDVYTLKEGTVYLLCSNGLINSLSEDVIYDILASGNEADDIADKLVGEALKNDSEDNITAVVVKIRRVSESEKTPEYVRNIPVRTVHLKSGRYQQPVRKKKIDAARLVSTAIILIVVAAIIFGIFTLWVKLRNPDARDTASDESSISTTAGTPSVDGTTQGTVAGTDVQNGNGGNAVSNGDSNDNAGTDNSNNSGNTGVSDNSGNSGGSAGTTVKPGTTYTVKAGDMLMKISVMFYGDESKYKLIMEANNIEDADKIQVGQILKIPPEE